MSLAPSIFRTCVRGSDFEPRQRFTAPQAVSRVFRDTSDFFIIIVYDSALLPPIFVIQQYQLLLYNSEKYVVEMWNVYLFGVCDENE